MPTSVALLTRCGSDSGTVCIAPGPWDSTTVNAEDRYDDSFADWDVPGKQVSEAALGWLEQIGPQEPFFLYIHYIDPHFPYVPPLAWRDRPVSLYVLPEAEARRLGPETLPTHVKWFPLKDGNAAIRSSGGTVRCAVGDVPTAALMALVALETD